MTLPGVDVASWQGAPGEWEPAAGDYQWAAVKFTELETNGHEYVNPFAGADWAALKAAGKGRIAYLYAQPAMAADTTVALFARVAAQLGLDPDDAIAVDLEETDGQTPAQVSAWAVDVFGRLKATFDRAPLVYTFRDFPAGGNCAGLEHYPLWISDPDHPAGSPQVPAPWTSWVIHQYSTSGNLDRDVIAYGNLEAMADVLGKSGADPAPAPAPSPTGWQEAMVQALPTIGPGALGPHVRVVQGLCNGNGYVLAVDGDYGPKTEAAVKAIQSRAKVTVDGIVGPQTYPALLLVA